MHYIESPICFFELNKILTNKLSETVTHITFVFHLIQILFYLHVQMKANQSVQHYMVRHHKPRRCTHIRKNFVSKIYDADQVRAAVLFAQKLSELFFVFAPCSDPFHYYFDFLLHNSTTHCDRTNFVLEPRAGENENSTRREWYSVCCTGKRRKVQGSVKIICRRRQSSSKC